MKSLIYKKIIFHVSFIIILVVLDILSKNMSSLILNPASTFNFFGLSLSEPVKNYNLIFGSNFGLSPIIIISYLTCIFCILLFYYIISLIFVPTKFYTLQIGISLLFGGFAGNFISKVSSLYTTDFIKWSVTPNVNFYFNFADVFQTIALVIIFSQIIHLRKIIWNMSNKRTQFIVMKKEQFQFIAYCLLGFLCFASFCVFFNYQFLGYAKSASLSNMHEINNDMLKYSISFLLFLGLFVAVFFIYLSNKIYGPIYAFERYIRALLKGEKPQDLKFRKQDQFKHLESLASAIKKHIK